MTNEERIERLERMNAALRARSDLMFITLHALLAGELNEAVLATRLESLIATALNTSAPDATVEALESDGGKYLAALAASGQSHDGNQP